MHTAGYRILGPQYPSAAVGVIKVIKNDREVMARAVPLNLFRERAASSGLINHKMCPAFRTCFGLRTHISDMFLFNRKNT